MANFEDGEIWSVKQWNQLSRRDVVMLWRRDVVTSWRATRTASLPLSTDSKSLWKY